MLDGVMTAYLRSLDDQTTWCIYTIGADGSLIRMNPAGLALVGAASEEAIRGRPYLELVSPRDRERVRGLMADAFAGQTAEFECTAEGPPPSRSLASCFIPITDAGGRVTQLVGVTRDRGQREQAEHDLRRLNRTHAVLSRCNRSLARAVDERALLGAFCINLVEVGRYGFVWVGYGGRGDARVRLVAHAEQGDRGFAAAVVSAANSGRGRSACRAACELGEPVILRDLSSGCDLAPWSDAALARGFHSMIALPLKADGEPFGNVSIFADTPDAFDAAEVDLLAELAEDLAFGIQTVRARSAEAQKVRGLRNDAERDARGRLAASLHDGVGQTLQALNLGLKQAREMVRRQKAVPMELLEQLVAEAGDALREVRVVSCELRPPFLEHLPLPDAVRLHCGEMAQRSGRSIRVDVDESPIVLDDRVKEQCFLAFREALSNALRHARASRILVALRVRPQKRLILVVMDDGVGFDTRQTFERPAGLGLCMIRERAESVRGCACIRSSHGSGTQVRINVPLSRGADPCT
jgi:signal transduction histidine kinase